MVSIDFRPNGEGKTANVEEETSLVEGDHCGAARADLFASGECAVRQELLKCDRLGGRVTVSPSSIIDPRKRYNICIYLRESRPYSSKVTCNLPVRCELIQAIACKKGRVK